MSTMEQMVREHRLEQERVAREAAEAAEAAEWSAMLREAYTLNAVFDLHKTEARGFSKTGWAE